MKAFQRMTGRQQQKIYFPYMSSTCFHFLFQIMMLFRIISSCLSCTDACVALRVESVSVNERACLKRSESMEVQPPSDKQRNQ